MAKNSPESINRIKMASFLLFVFFTFISCRSKWDLRWTALDPQRKNTENQYTIDALA